ncbi:4'-phosphopantetheinyl transferase superfamily protein [Hymenobacter sp. BT559]|uniref:4'-phosphopantetheinyl transferase family protein n=1 Tax=Hymenobacter sp. BT559 TaxID=2795729 RepID=UPI0018EC3674|nr:4'-phosphopantetheinyl transferase superfamily protein [Hymenobacter sp. BT559]MBJ6142550.1 4'-phosphopantetheinyl transferase superfamily protein [Hymenobacter sp. BT559]
MPLYSIRPLPGGAHLGLWHLTETPTALWPQLATPEAYRPLLPARADGPRQAQWLAGRVLVHHLLATVAPDAGSFLLQNDATGRPFLISGTDLGPAISLSHSGEWVAALLAPAGTALGVDVEVVRDKALRIARKFLTDQELAATELGSSAEPGTTIELFSLLWSAKETLYKLAGQRGIIFRQNLLLDLPAAPPPPATWPSAGELAARLELAGRSSRHRICYFRPAEGYVLTYCYSLSSLA